MKLGKILKRIEQLRELAAEFPVDSPRVRDLKDEILAEYVHDCAMGKCSPGKAAALAEVFEIAP